MSVELKDYALDGFLNLILGLFLIIFPVGYPIFQWNDNRTDFYTKYPDIIPGTEILFGLLILFPIFILGFYLGVKGMGDLINALRVMNVVEKEDDLL